MRELVAAAALAFCSAVALAQQPVVSAKAAAKEDDALTKYDKSPWLLAPVFQSNPKLGTSLGVLAGYLHYFDEKSHPSIFAVTGQYTTTDSTVAGAFAKTSFDEDHQRLLAGIMFGNIKNDYDDYLGSGVPLRNTATLSATFARYLYRVKGNWFVGAQGMYQNFVIAGETPFDDQLLDILGLQPFKSAGVGLVLQNDSRDSENMPTKGAMFNLNNMAYRESLGGQNDYDVYRFEIRYYYPHAQGNVLALRQLNHWSSDAIAAARAPIQLRGYKVGQFTGENMSSIEVEERFRLAERWTATLFAGVACLYGSGQSCTDSANVFPAGGAGIQYILKPKEGVVMNLEYAMGKDGDYAFLLKMGYAY